MNTTSQLPMSDEQNRIYEEIFAGNNVIVDACAGSGKSTTILSISSKMSHKKIVKMTYNSMLCKEIKSKVETLNLSNICVYTYHGLTKRYYSLNCHTDTVIRKVLRDNSPPIVDIPHFDILVIDECQDMTLLYFKLLIKFCRDHGKKIQLLILGDYMQGLYEFKGADTRFLTLAEKIWNNFELLMSPVFVKCYLKTSYRITQQMADFVNRAMLNQERLFACKEGEKVVYIRRSTCESEKYVISKIKMLLSSGFSPSDFFILGGSVKGKRSEIRKMENALVENNIPCHVPMIENDKIDEKVIEGKVVFSTFHSVKGRQRKFVFVVGFDNSYFDIFAKNLSHNDCPNTLYVACTRATHILFLIEKRDRDIDRPFVFLKMNHLEMKNSQFIDFQGMPQTIFYKSIKENDKMIYEINGKKKKIYNTTPTDLIKFIGESTLEEIIPLLEKIFILSRKKEKEIEIPTIIKTKNDFYEDVSELNGITIPLMYFEKKLGVFDENDDNTKKETLLYDIIEKYMNDTKENEYIFLKKYIKSLPRKCKTTSEYLKLSNAYIAMKEKLYFKINQIDNYNWLSDNILQECYKQMDDILLVGMSINENESEFWKKSNVEKTIIEQGDHIAHEKIDNFLLNYFPENVFRLTARVDLLTSNSIYEIKCVSDFTNENFLQIVIYAWIWKYISKEKKKFYIFNIRNGERYTLNASKEELDIIMLALLKNKYEENIIKANDVFLHETINEVVNTLTIL
jgi:hypothetical protein